ncbi:sugar transferase [Patescibacteria group bacterium]|nr:sugar transferase [Patescibacteria group bacterium]
MQHELVKRIIDVAGSLVLLVIFSPVMIVVSILIKLTSPGPIIIEKTNIHSIRTGKKGKKFRIYKFRSMIVDAERILKTDPRYKKLYRKYKNSSFKLHKDPRITPLGRFIRKHSIDEVPQFFNVLKGEMSIVGPRAYLPEELEEQLQKYPQARKLVNEMLKVKPGITGFWQVSGRRYSETVHGSSAPYGCMARHQVHRGS